MKAVELLGDTPRDMMDYVGWLLNQSAHFVQECGKSVMQTEMTSEFAEALAEQYSDRDHFAVAIEKARTFLSQPMRESWFVRGDEPKESDFVGKIRDLDAAIECYKQAHKKWQNWQPLFLGEWEIVSCYYRDFWGVKEIVQKPTGIHLMEWSDKKTLNEFLYETKDIEKKYNPEFEIR